MKAMDDIIIRGVGVFKAYCDKKIFTDEIYSIIVLLVAKCL